MDLHELSRCQRPISLPMDGPTLSRIDLLTSSVFAAAVGSMRLVKLVLLPCLLLLDRQPTSATSPAAILAILSFSKHCDSGMPNTRPPAESEIKTQRIRWRVSRAKYP